MRVTRDPRCPEHPGYAAYLTTGGDRLRRVYWTCTACRRFLGLATLQPDVAFFHPSVSRVPYHRRLPVSELDAKDWDWLLASSPERDNRNERRRDDATCYQG